MGNCIVSSKRTTSRLLLVLKNNFLIEFKNGCLTVCVPTTKNDVVILTPIKTIQLDLLTDTDSEICIDIIKSAYSDYLNKFHVIDKSCEELCKMKADIDETIKVFRKMLFRNVG